ncbi:MAG: hypothetical protein AB1486_20770 [Planctomycetota bacterium]
MRAVCTCRLFRALLFMIFTSSPVLGFAGLETVGDSTSTGEAAPAEGVTPPVAVSSQAGAVQDETVQSPALQAFGRLPLAFVENRGQLDRRVAFSIRQGSLSAYFTKDAIVLGLTLQAPAPHRAANPEPGPAGRETRAGANIYLTFEGASPDVAIEGREQLPGRYNFLRGNDPSKWCTSIASYASIRYRGLYTGVDMVVRDGGGRLEYDLLLEPGADVDAITVRCEGGESLRLEADGALILETAAGPLEQPRPCTYELGPDGTRQPVECSYRLLGDDRFGFQVPDRNRAAALVIDPGLVFGTFLGGADDESGWAMALDASGEVLLTGYALSFDFPTTPGAYDTTYNGGYYDAFVAKLSADGATLLYATYLGGAGSDGGFAIALGASGTTLVTGLTSSPDFPTTPGAYDTSHNGDGDAFVARLSADGSSLLYGTFLGGSAYDSGSAIALDASGTAVVTGLTVSSDFPTTPNAYDRSWNGWGDVFMVKLDSSGSTLLYATFLGGYGDDRERALALDAAGAAVITGYTDSADFPTTPGAYDRSWNGWTDAFVAKLDSSGSVLLYGTFLGSAGYDQANAIALDASGAAVVVGYGGAEFPTTPDAYDPTYNGNGDAFLVKLSADGSTLLYGTFLGGWNYDEAYGIALEASGAAVVTGFTSSSHFPTTPGAYDRSMDGWADAFVAKLSADGSSLLYGTFLGGSSGEAGRAIALDASEAAVVTGYTNSADFPATPGAYDTTYNGGDGDAFVVKLDPSVCETAADWSNYGSGWPGTDGVPCLVANSDPSVCLPLSLTLGNSLGANTAGYLFLALSPADLPTPWDGHLLVEPDWVFSLSVPGDGVTLDEEVPCDPALCGFHLYLQVLELDPGASCGVSFTPGLELVLGS